MKCALAAIGFINGNVTHNKTVILETMQRYASKADIVVFGEAFLQGFYAANFDVAHDEKVAIRQDDLVIEEIREAAKENQIAVSFGFVEKSGEFFYSSQITIDAQGNIIDLYRRVSPGWKLPEANVQYREGPGFHVFTYMQQKIAVGLCGDLWFDENVNEMRQLHPDLIFWPVYTDFNYQEWNTSAKYEYAQQAGKIGGKILYVNSVCADREFDEVARGGAVFFEDGKICEEISSGQEGVLIVEVCA